MVRGKKKSKKTKNETQKTEIEEDFIMTKHEISERKITNYFSLNKPYTGLTPVKLEINKTGSFAQLDIGTDHSTSITVLSDAFENENRKPTNGFPIWTMGIHKFGSLSPASAISKLSISASPPKTSKNKTRRRLNVSPTSRQLTDFFPVRRSERKCRSNIQKERKKEVEEAILSGKEEGLKVETFSGKGRGVIATKPFRRGEFVVEYSGELIDMTEAKLREVIYAQDQNTGCYMYYFTYNNRQLCVDATAETTHLGRLVNHSRHGNLVTKTFVVDSVPHLILVAKRDIDPGEELLYDYGDRSKLALASHPWLAT